MLIDFIPAQKLPHFVVWIDWIFYAYKFELLLFLITGLLTWMVFCFINYGPGVG